MKNKLLILFLAFVSQVSFSQAKVVERVEIDVKDEGYLSNFNVYSLKEQGLINIYYTKEAFKTPIWHFDKYSTSLSKTKSESVEVNKKFSIVDTYSSKTHFYILMSKKGKYYKVLGIDFSTMDVKVKDGEFPKRSSLSDMTVLNGIVYLNSATKRESYITTIDWNSGKTRVTPITIKDAKNKNVNISGLITVEKTKEVFAVVNSRVKKQYSTHIFRFNENGKKKDQFELSKKLGEDKSFTDVSVSSVGDNEYIFTGTYGRTAALSNGLFIAKVTGTKVEFVETYNFLKLNNFLSYLNARKVKRIEKKQKRKEKRGKELTYNYRIACHDIIKKGDRYMFLGEAYYPTYRTETRTVTNANGTTTTTTRQVFDGYQYTHAVITSFDASGQLLWDNTFELYSAYKPFYVKKFISVSEAKDEEVNMIFTSGRYIYTKTVDQFNGKTLDEEKSEIQTTDDDTDKVRRSNTDSDYWYGNSFVTFGFQKVKNKSGNGKRKRKVHFINKVEF